MALTKYRLGDLLIRHDVRNYDNAITNVKGISVKKEFREPTSKVNREELTDYKLVYPNQFGSIQTTHNEKCFAFAYNDTNEVIVISSVNLVFSIKDECIILPRWLQIFFNRPEFDRYARFNSWGSAREIFGWDDICNVEIELPPIEIQQKYVDIYNAMLTNQQSYERGLDDLKLVCDAYIEDLRKNVSCERIGDYLLETKQRNENAELLPNMSVSNTKIFIDAKESVVSGVDTKNYLIVEHNDFAYNTVTTRNADKLSIALNTAGRCLVSPLYTTFRVVKEGLIPEYLNLWFNRGEYDRYARFESWGSARELFSFGTLANTKIPIPDIAIQKDIVNIFCSYSNRNEINKNLKAQIKDICPILIKGSIEEGRKAKEA